MTVDSTSLARKVGTLRRTYPLPLGYRVELRIGPSEAGVAQLAAEWTPRIPSGADFAKVLPAYRAARGDFTREIARRIGCSVATVEV